jgi:uncharacterized caspase-like protein
MNGLVVNFVRRAATAHVALLFYAGHGMQIDGKNYLLPVDAKFDGAFDADGKDHQASQDGDFDQDPSHGPPLLAKLA